MRTVALASLSLAALAGCSLTGEPRFVRPIVVADSSVIAMDSAADVSSIDGAPDDATVIGPDAVPPIDVVADDSVALDDANVIGTDAVTADVGVACPPSLTNCDEQCVNVTNNPRNCGACSRVCPSGPNSTATCSMGACGLACAVGFANCDDDPLNGCEVALGTIANCASCGNACPPLPGATPTCTGGTCGTTCMPGFANCDGMSVNGCETRTTTSSTNCGACGRGCSNPTPVCSGSTCVTGCTGTQLNCGGGCIDPNTDPRNCGGCGTGCSGGPNGAPTCVGGVCNITCAAGFSDCDSRMATGCETNTQSDINNCGACGRACPTNVSGGRVACVAGECKITCEPGRLDCDRSLSTGCETLAMSNNNCGACGNSCAALGVCASSAGSTPTCAIGIFCGGLLNGVRCGLACVDVRTDVNNCGGCNVRCSSATGVAACVDGRCGSCPAGTSFCPMSGQCCSGALRCMGTCRAATF